MKNCIFALAAVGLLMLVFGCGDQGEPAIIGNGTITYSSIEGGCWGITFDGGAQYEISDLPDSFKQEGVRVRLVAQLSQERFSFCNLGAKINIIEIHKL